MNILDLDPGLAAVVASVREANEPIQQAIAEDAEILNADWARLHGAVTALLGAIDARLPQPVQPAVALKAVA